MLNRIVQSALRFRGVVIALACVLIGYGIFVAAHAKLDVFPEFVQPQVTVQSEAPGLAPEQVEALVTRPIESELSGVGNLESIRSESIQGLSVVTAVFKEGTDIYVARQMLAERLATLAGELPLGVKPPKMSPLTSSTMDLLKFGLVSDQLSPMALRTFADWTVRPRLLSVPGVAKVTVFGGEVRQLQVQVKPERLIAFELSVQDVFNAAREATGVRGATFIETAIRNMKSSLLLGAVLVAIVLFLFLLDLRTALISFTAIPLSLLAAIIVLDRFGATLNTMTLGGLAVAIGVVVDDAIIDVENILRRLRAHSAKRTATGGAGAGTPLTPALSPGERERQSALSAQNATAPPADAGKLSPLPEGEGQGEGEAATSTPPTPSPAEDLRAVFQVV